MSARAPDAAGRPNLAGPLALLLIVITLVWAAGDRLQRMEAALYDFLQQAAGATPAGEILLVDTGPATHGKDFWTDPRIAAAVARLAQSGAAVIVPAEPPADNTATPDMRQLTTLLELEQRARQRDLAAEGGRDVAALSAQLDGFRQQFENRAATERALRDSGRAVVPMAAAGTAAGERSNAVDCRRLALAVAGEDASPLLAAVRPSRELLSLPNPLCRGAAAVGYAGFRPDADGIVRESALLVRSGDRILPTVALAAFTVGRGAGPAGLSGPRHLDAGGERLATGPGYTVLTRYYADGDPPFETVGLDALADGRVPEATLAGRTVFLGQFSGPAPLIATPVGELPAPLLMASSLSNLVQGDYLVRPGWFGWAEVLLLILLAIAFLTTVPPMSLQSAALAGTVLATFLVIAEVYLFIVHGIWIKLGTAALFCVLGIGALLSLRFAQAGMPVPMPVPQPAGGPVSSEDELDLAFSVLRQQAPNDDTKERLYQIAMTHGRRKEFAKAERVLRYLASLDPNYRGVGTKLEKLSGARKAAAAREEGQSGAPAPPVMRPAASGGRTLGRYQVERVLGRGAMATVYLGLDPKINRKVAIKTIALAEEFSQEDLEAAKAQFLREAESAGRLNHPNIISIYDVGDDRNVAYLAMEYFPGKAMSHYAQPNNLLPPKWVVELGARAAEALHYAHGQNVVHRDIKPANLLYDANTDQLKLTDFGIARLTDTSRTKTGIILGTPSYMSPEQLSGTAVTGQSDLYSLGITLYHLLTGAPPFRADSIPKLMDKIVNERHAPLTSLRDDVPACLDEVFARALAKDPADRFANGRAMALALRDCCSSFAD